MRKSIDPSLSSPFEGKLPALIAFVCAAIALAICVWALTNMGDGLVDRLAFRRVVGVAGLSAALLTGVGVWSWRRAAHESRRTPEGRSGLLKVKRGDDWFAETVGGKWLKWDGLASDWKPSSPPDDPALTSSVPSSHRESAAEDAGDQPLPAEAQLALMAAEADFRRRERKMRRARFGARTGASFAIGGLALLLVGGLLAFLFAGLVRFLSDLPF